MPLSSEKDYGVKPLTEAINNLPSTPTIIRDSGLFVETPLTTTHVDVGSKDGELKLVQAVPRGTKGEGVNRGYGKVRTFKTTHLPKNDTVFADDVQNVAAFGDSNKAMTVNELVLDKTEAMKSDIEYSREHLQLGALQGKIINADGSVIYDLYQEFGLRRSEYVINLSNDKLEVGKNIDNMLISQGKNLGNHVSKGWIAYCSPEFLLALQYHPKIKELYARFADGADVYREGIKVAFHHRGVDFVNYTHKFGTDADIKEGEAHLAPLGTKLFKEYLSPANMSSTVNTKALAYYLSREPLDHQIGWDLYAQSNPLPLVLRPQVLATLRME